jgi:hypothetical protein
MTSFNELREQVKSLACCRSFEISNGYLGLGRRWLVCCFGTYSQALKATVLVILGCILCYDLTTKTHDVSSLRVYRGKCHYKLLACGRHPTRVSRSHFISHSDSLQQDLLCWPLRLCVVPIHYEHGDEMVWHVMN